MNWQKAILPWLGGVVAACAAAGTAHSAAFTLTTLDAETARPTPCRVHLADAAGKQVRAPGLPFWHDHFVCDGAVHLELAPGKYSFVVERGPEYFAVTGSVTLAEGRSVNVTKELRRLADLAREGWWSGETHVHRPVRDMELLMRAEDLHLAGVQTWWNNANPWRGQALPKNAIVRFDGNRFYDRMSGEDERGGGALLYFGLKQPLPIAGSKREYPSSVRFLREAKRAAAAGRDGGPPVWVDIEKPFWWDTPLWLASGLVDSVGIAHNHMQRGGVLDNEAWGKPRDRAKYPPAWGNGLWTQDIYYHILNCGLRIPPSAGSASGVLPNPVGYNRAYVHVEGELTCEKWWEGLREGRVFVGNGPLLRLRANGQLPGQLFKSGGPLQVRLQGQLDSRDPIKAVEIVRNGQVERMSLPQLITIQESGWFLVRAIADVTNTFRFASTGPWYVEIGGKPLPVRRESAQLFLEWVEERKSNLIAALTNAEERNEVLRPVQEAEKFWKEKVARAVPKTTQMLTDFRRPKDEADLRFWLENMTVYHRFTPGEISAATGLTLDEISAALRKFDLAGKIAPRRAPGEPLRVLPYPGGRHPRLGFFEGALMPQRETKVSVFTPWGDGGYVVVDLPEAVFSNLGLIYLAHTHIPTLWDLQGITLPRLEWQRHKDGALESERTLPNRIAFGAKVRPTPTAVRMELWLRNGTREKLSGLRVQNCVMLGYAPGFAAQTLTNKVFDPPYAAVFSDDGRRWVITAWEPVQRCWGNDQCPCLHSDPQFPDCSPGETKRLRGWLSFYEGTNVLSEFRRIQGTGWRDAPFAD